MLSLLFLISGIISLVSSQIEECAPGDTGMINLNQLNVNENTYNKDYFVSCCHIEKKNNIKNKKKIGFSIEYLGESNPSEDKYCYTYFLTRSSSNWFCDEKSDQAWNVLYLDPCANLPNGDIETLDTLNNALYNFENTAGAVHVTLFILICILS